MRVFSYPDIHWGVRDKAALACADAAHRAFKPHLTIIGGDLLDCRPFSRHARINQRDVEKAERWVADELVPASAWLDGVQRRTKHTVFLEGNHEHWVDRYLANAGILGKTLAPLIGIRQTLLKGRSALTFQPWVANGRPNFYRISSGLYATHGWTTCKAAARKHLELIKDASVIYFHTHRMESFVSRMPRSGRRIEARSPGCLCSLTMDYTPGGSPNDASHGFELTYVGKRSYTSYSVSIDRGRCVLPDGREISP